MATDAMRQAAAFTGISVETLRKAKVVIDVLPEGRGLLASGEHSVDALYRRAVGDEWVGLSVKVPKGLRVELRRKARELGVSQSGLVLYALAAVVGYDLG